MKILFDMNLSPKLVYMLTRRGFEAEYWSSIGAFDAKDTEIIVYTYVNNYVILTCDLDFSTILTVTPGKKPSVIQLHLQSVELEKMAEIVDSVVAQTVNALEKEAVLSINTEKSWIRFLPLL